VLLSLFLVCLFKPWILLEFFPSATTVRKVCREERDRDKLSSMSSALPITWLYQWLNDVDLIPVLLWGVLPLATDLVDSPP